jgi:hypothetical protein
MFQIVFGLLPELRSSATSDCKRRARLVLAIPCHAAMMAFNKKLSVKSFTIAPMRESEGAEEAARASAPTRLAFAKYGRGANARLRLQDA